MKTKLITLTVIATMLVVATVAMANGTLITETIFEYATDSSDAFFLEEDFEFGLDLSDPHERPTSTSYELVEDAAFFFNEFAEASIISFDNYITAEISDSEELKQIKNKFINVMVDYRMTSDELEYITTLSGNYDIDMLLDIYKFLRWTNSDISIIPEIYRTGEENSDEKHWIYDAYDKALNRTDDMLSVEDVAYYIASGLSIDEIAGAYELSFAGIKTTKQMLNERLNGASWNSIAAPVISDTPNVITEAPEMTINDILTYRGYSVRMRKDVSDILYVENGIVTVTADVVSELQNSHGLKQSFIKQFDADIPVIKPEPNNTILSDSDTSTLIYETDKYLYEEDYIPVEEPEVD